MASKVVIPPMAKPILVLQMQRMGDLILSFPLMGMLQNIYAGHPLWTVAEEQFFTPLMSMAPQTVFFPPSAASQLMRQSYRAVINLSHRQDAAQIAGSVDAEERFGAYTQGGKNFIGGNWALYRASIVQNNRYNRFHWSDLHFLDHVQSKGIPPWNVNVCANTTGSTVGIFVGASEIEKRPSAAHFAKIAKALSHKGYTTIFLGGPSDVALGQEAERLSGLKGASLCGRFNLQQLAQILQNLALFITPDTGPMHLAAWLNTPILNLSLGPVSPYETGPRSTKHSHHTVVQPALSCAGCWQACAATPPCHAKLSPFHVARIAHALIQKQPLNPIAGLHIYRTGMDAHGLFTLNRLYHNQEQANSRERIAHFWQAYFWHYLTQDASSTANKAQKAFHTLSAAHPPLAEKLRTGIIALGRDLRSELKNTLIHKKNTLTKDFWRKYPQILHPFSSYAYFYLQNNEYSLSAWENIINHMENLYNTVQ